MARASLSGGPFALGIDNLKRVRARTLVLSANTSTGLLNVPNRLRGVKQKIDAYTAYSKFFCHNGGIVVINNKSSTVRRTGFLAGFTSRIAIIRHHSRLETSGVVRSHTGRGTGVS